MIFKPIVQRIVIPCCEADGRTLYNRQQIIVEIRDEAAGPYLAICGRNTEPMEDEEGCEFYLQTVEEIDEVADILKKILLDAQENLCETIENNDDSKE